MSNRTHADRLVREGRVLPAPGARTYVVADEGGQDAGVFLVTLLDHDELASGPVAFCSCDSHDEDCEHALAAKKVGDRSGEVSAAIRYALGWHRVDPPE